MLMFLPGLGSPQAPTHPDERLYLGVSAEMHRTGAWLTPTLDGVPTWHKPPLLYWAERVAYGAFGTTLFAGRLPVALASIALALLTGLLAARAFGRRALLPAALVCGSALGLLKFGRLAMMDVPLALALTAAALATWRACEQGRPRALLGAGLAVGAGCLLKGPVAAVIAAGAFGGFVALRRPRLLVSRYALGAVALAGLVAVPWYLASVAVHGRAFFDFFIVGENLSRFSMRWTFARELQLLGGFVVFLLPWTVLALANLRPIREPAALLALLWIGVTLLVFTIPGHKYPHYGVACLPAAVLLVVRRPPPAWALRVTAIVIGVCALGLLLAVRWPFAWDARLALLAAGAGAAVGAVALWKERLAIGAASTGAGAAIVIALAIPLANPPLFPEHALGAAGPRPIYVYNGPAGGFALASGRVIPRLWGDAELARAMREGGAVIVSERELERVNQAAGAPLAVLSRWPRISRSLEAGTLVASWTEADVSRLFESMMLIAAAPAP